MSLTVAQIAQTIEHQAPTALACEWDRIGLMVGNPQAPVNGVFVCLDLTQQVIEEAVAAGCQMIVSHHPLGLKPIDRLITTRYPDSLFTSLIQSQLSWYVAHTNWDHCPHSMSGELLRRLNATAVKPWLVAPRTARTKVVTFVPPDHADTVRAAMCAAGAGVLGEYDQCAYHSPGFGTFRGSENANPAIGQAGQFEQVEELRMEMVCPPHCLAAVLAALWDTHPYEEVAYDVYHLDRWVEDGHAIWTCCFEAPVSLAELSRLVEQTFTDGSHSVPFVGCPNQLIQKIATVAGAGGGVLPAVFSTGCDVFMTGDISHHHALDAQAQALALIDLDHYYSERLFMPLLAQMLASCQSQGVTIQCAEQSHAPFRVL